MQTGVTKVSTEPEKKPAKKKPEYGVELTRRRKELHLSLDDLVGEINHPTIYREKIWRLEVGKRQPHKLDPLEVKLLAKGLQWTPEQLAKVLNIVLPKEGEPTPKQLYASSKNDSVDFVVVNKYSFNHNQWMSSKLPNYLAPAGVAPTDIFFVDVDGSLLASVDLHEHLREGMTLVFRADVQPDNQDTVLMNDPEQNIYALVTYSEAAPMVAAVRLDASATATLMTLNVVGVLTKYAQTTSSLRAKP